MLYKVTSAHEEGGERVYSVSTTHFEGDEDGNVQCAAPHRGGVQRRQAGARRPGTERKIPAQLVTLAMGFTGTDQENGLVQQFGLELDERGNVARDADFATNVAGVFVAGDAGRGQSLIVWAIAEGRSAARGVDRFLTGASELPGPDPPDGPRADGLIRGPTDVPYNGVRTQNAAPAHVPDRTRAGAAVRSRSRSPDSPSDSDGQRLRSVGPARALRTGDLAMPERQEHRPVHRPEGLLRLGAAPTARGGAALAGAVGERVFCSGHVIGQFEAATRRPQLEMSKQLDEVLGRGAPSAAVPAGPDVEGSGLLRGRGGAGAAGEDDLRVRAGAGPGPSPDRGVRAGHHARRARRSPRRPSVEERVRGRRWTGRAASTIRRGRAVGDPPRGRAADADGRARSHARAAAAHRRTGP